MEIALVVGLLVIGATVGALVMYAGISDRRPLIDQFNEIHNSPESMEERARRVL